MLTGFNRRCLTAIASYQLANDGVSPACTDVAAALGINSKGRVSEAMSQLEAEGYIRRITGRNRAIEVLRCPDLIPIFDARTHQVRGFIS